jgi:hypothetical protein
MMSGEAWLYLLAVLLNAVNLFLQVFFTIMYSDLEWCVRYSTLILSVEERLSAIEMTAQRAHPTFEPIDVSPWSFCVLQTASTRNC